MKYLSILPAIGLMLAMLYANISGNDKSAYIVLGVGGINVICLLVGILLSIAGKLSWRSMSIIVIPTLYLSLALYLGRKGIIDPQAFLGIR